MVVGEFQYSERQAYKLLEMDRSSYRYDPRPDRNGALREALMGWHGRNRAMDIAVYGRC